MAEQTKLVQMIASEHGGSDFSWVTKAEDRSKLWRARHDVAYADRALREEGQLWTTDVCVPISRLAECIIETQKDVAASFLPAPIVGHAGDGNFHVVIVLNPNNPEEIAEAERPQRAGSRSRDVSRWHLHRRARYRLRKDGFLDRRTWRGCECYARYQERD